MKCGHNSLGDTEANIQALEWFEPIRRRAGMYIGSTDARGLHHMLFELVNETLDPFSGDSASSVRVLLCADGSVEISDDCSPPVNLAVAFWALNVNSHSFLSRSVTNALSEELTVRARRAGEITQCIFRRGQLHATTQSSGSPDDCGLTVRFRPDPAIFGTLQFDPDTVRTRLRQCAFLHSGVRITLVNETNGTEDMFDYADGAAEYAKWLNANRTPLHPEPVKIHGEAHGVCYAVALQWCAESEYVSASAANAWITPHGGTHVNGFHNGYSRALLDQVRRYRPEDQRLRGEELRRGLTAVVAVRLLDPRFESQSRERLTSLEVERIVRSGVHRSLRDYFETDTEHAKMITISISRSQD